MGLFFEWDQNKADQNLKKHNVDFTEAATVFGDPLSLTIIDHINSIMEHRFIIIGRSYKNRLLVVAHSERCDNIRIISARIATTKEKKIYEEGK